MNPVIVLTGPTGSGKSHIVYSLPEGLPIEIINADSRQIYQHMNIGTAMPQENELQRFQHQMFNFLSPSKVFSAGQYVKMCSPLIDEIHSRNKIPMILGGTFFYIKALWDGLIENIEIPEEIQNQVNRLSREEAYELLTRHDAERSQKLFPSDEHRVKRSLQLILSSHRQISTLRRSEGVYNKYNFQSFYVDMDRALLYERINERVKVMFEKGLIREVGQLIQAGFTSQDPGLNAIGYKEILQINREKNLKLEDWPESVKTEAIDKISQATRNFAKRQLTWFRNEDRLKRIDPIHAVSQISELILRYTQIK